MRQHRTTFRAEQRGQVRQADGCDTTHLSVRVAISLMSSMLTSAAGSGQRITFRICTRWLNEGRPTLNERLSRR